MLEWNDKDTLVRHHYDRGILQSQFAISNSLKGLADKGNITAVQEFKKLQLENEIENLKTQFFNNEY